MAENGHHTSFSTSDPNGHRLFRVGGTKLRTVVSSEVPSKISARKKDWPRSNVRNDQYDLIRTNRWLFGSFE